MLAIKKSLAAVGGAMPVFGAQLNRRKQDAIIAHIQSRWPDEVYRVWAHRVERINTNR